MCHEQCPCVSRLVSDKFGGDISDSNAPDAASLRATHGLSSSGPIILTSQATSPARPAIEV
jgi:hypothetical protein